MNRIALSFLILFFLATKAAYSDIRPEKNEAGFATVDAALTFLKEKPDVTFNLTKPDGWLIATEQSPYAVWSFAPSGHYAYPAVVKRELKQNAQGGVYIDMSAVCEANKHSCDRLINEFRALNTQSRKSVTDALNK